MISRLLLILAAAPYPAVGEITASSIYRSPDLYQYDYLGMRATESLQAERKPTRVSPTFKPVSTNTDNYKVPQRRHLQQDLLRRGFRFRNIPEGSGTADHFPRFRTLPNRGQAENIWSTSDRTMRQAPKFRPLGNTHLKQIGSATRRGWVKPAQAPVTHFGLSGYSTELPSYSPVGPKFRPIP